MEGDDEFSHDSDEAVRQLYPVLRAMAGKRMVFERAGHTLQPTALANEAWLRMHGGRDQVWRNSTHFCTAAAKTMRRILIDRARRTRRQKHAGKLRQVPVDYAESKPADDDEPDVDPSGYVGGIDASMSMRQVIDVSSLASAIDEGAQTVFLDFAVFDNDVADQSMVTLEFLDASDNDLGYRSVFESGNYGPVWKTIQQAAYPPVGTRKIRLTMASIKNLAGGTSVRNIHFDNVRARLVDFDAEMDDMPDDWELAHGLDPDDSGDAATSADIEVTDGTDPLDPDSPAPNLQIVNVITTRDGTGQVTKVEVVVRGLNVNKTYKLVRGTDLATFPDIVDTYQPAASTDSFIDFSPPPKASSSKAFYRVGD
ncbi:ECF-type sigma factor [Luteolibacter marinus]|uniref:ECF-type sigma factor n=1 Tax=Luteolibacter marinus TaxID=2776705 RepID=UPI001865C810|nr:ECF-type sigma factor [Luteolibacter marinus]